MNTKNNLNMKKLVLYLLVVLLSCITVQSYAKPPQQQLDLTKETTVSILTYFEASSRNLETPANAINLPIIAEIQVLQKRIVYTEKEAFKKNSVTDVVRRNEKNMKEALAEYKRLALAKAANANNADLIFGATFMVETTDDNHFAITVTGYPAVYKNFHTATAKDVELLKMMEPYMQKSYTDPQLNSNNTPITYTVKKEE